MKILVKTWTLVKKKHLKILLLEGVKRFHHHQTQPEDHSWTRTTLSLSAAAIGTLALGDGPMFKAPRTQR
jgi:hypothetical protein